MEELKQQVKEVIVSDDTNRLYIRTEKYPDGELIMYKEVDEFVDSLIDKTVQMTEERIVGIIKEYQTQSIDKMQKLLQNGIYQTPDTIDTIISLITNKIELNEFPRGKEMYCPKCYFDNDKEILKVDCDGHNK